MGNDDQLVERVMAEADRQASERERLGAVGLAVEIGELDSLHPPVSCPTGTSIRDAVRNMQRRQIGFMLIVDGPGLLGIFTERNLVDTIAAGKYDLDTTPVDAVMSPRPECLGRSYQLVYAVNLMSVGGCRHVPVLDDSGRPVNVISPRNVVEHLANQFPKEVFNLPPSPQRTISDALEGA